MTRLEPHGKNSGLLTSSLQRIGKTRWGFHLLLQALQLHDFGVAGYARWQAGLFSAWSRERRNRCSYRVLSEAELKGSRKSDTVFIFGSGYSLNDITSPEWRHFEKHDTLGLSGFIYQDWVRVDYHLIRGWAESKESALKWRGLSEDFATALNNNPYFRDTILILQGEYLAQFCNGLIGHGLIRPGTRIFRYRTSRGAKYPTRDLKDGLCHTAGTLSDAVNFAYCTGWKEIVLVGVDLYDCRYFWLKPDETLTRDEENGAIIAAQTNFRGMRYDQSHNTVLNGIVQTMSRWREQFDKDNVNLVVYNSRSLLRDVLPPYVTR